MSEINKVEFGVSDLIFYEEKADGTYGEPFAVKGTTEITLSSKSEKTELYADNGIFHVFASNNGYEGELSIYNFDDNLKVMLFGFEKDANGNLVEPSVLIPKKFGISFKIQGDVKKRASVLYSCTFEKPDSSYKTVEDKPNVEVLKCKFKASPKQFANGKSYVQLSTTTEKYVTQLATKIVLPNDAGK